MTVVVVVGGCAAQVGPGSGSSPWPVGGIAGRSVSVSDTPPSTTSNRLAATRRGGSGVVTVMRTPPVSAAPRAGRCAGVAAVTCTLMPAAASTALAASVACAMVVPGSTGVLATTSPSSVKPTS